MKATALAPANIAFIKYWGKRDTGLRLPTNPSISMNLDSCTTTTTVEFSEQFQEDEVRLDSQNILTKKQRPLEKSQFEKTFSMAEKDRIRRHLNIFRKLAKVKIFARVTTQNSFPAAAGIASSASGFAALTVAAASALGLDLSEEKLSELARLGSGSACRSIPDGFVKWEDEFARSLYPPEYWDLRDIIVIVDDSSKSVSSSIGHEQAPTSPFFEKRVQAIPDRIRKIEYAFTKKDFHLLGSVIEEDCLDLHHVMETQTPPLHYMNSKTHHVIDLLKQSKLPAYVTIDAGPNVHIICESKDEEAVIKLFSDYHIIVNKPTKGARVI